MLLSGEQELLLRAEELVRRRATTDRRMGSAWMLVPLLPMVIAIVLVAAFVNAIVPLVPDVGNLSGSEAFSSVAVVLVGIYLAALLSTFAVLFLLSIAIYYLIDRRNSHFKRQQLLFRAFAKHSGTRGTSSAPGLPSLEELCEDAEFEEQNRPAGIWAILNLFLGPVVSLTVGFTLTQDLCKHDARQRILLQNLASTFTAAGTPLPTLDESKPLKRDPILFLLLTIITAGFFWIYWFYTLLKDYNEHFTHQAIVEDRIIQALKPMVPTLNCKGCGGSVPQGAKFCPFCGVAQTT